MMSTAAAWVVGELLREGKQNGAGDAWTAPRQLVPNVVHLFYEGRVGFSVVKILEYNQ